MPNTFLENLFSLSGKTAVIIGGTGVLGGALAEGIAQAGAFTFVAGRGAERGLARVEAIKKLGGQASYLSVDITRRESIDDLLAAAVKQRGRVDILVNCAGVNAGTPYFEAKDDDWQRILLTNLTSTHWACQIFGAHMAHAGGGSILNIGSVSAHLPLSRVFAYAASKAGVVNLTKNVARELAPHKVRVNVLCPGFFPAEQNRKILSPERIEAIMSKTPMARFGESNELIGATILLLSEKAASFITGADVYVDGGFTAMSI
ncbi:MAG TPA: SDR family oxidoreductase [Pirellulales bacterium]|jgi:NAD(P)-dependent dehydrogenase (short-subunit alcohol dehydrogenase family)